MCCAVTFSDNIDVRGFRLFSVDHNDELSDSHFNDLIKIQLDSYDAFINGDAGDPNNLYNIFESAFPISDHYGKMVLEFVSCNLGKPKFDEDECVRRGVSYSAPFQATLRLVIWNNDLESSEDQSENSEDFVDCAKEQHDKEDHVYEIEKKTKQIIEQSLYVGDIPIMTSKGTFIINGTERVVVSQVHRAPGVFFSHDSGKNYSSGKLIYSARLIPYRGSWLDFEFDVRDVIFFRIDKKRKIPISVLLKALEMTDADILHEFYDVISCDYISGNWVVDFDPNAFLGLKLPFDLYNADDGSLCCKRGIRVTPLLIKKLQAKNLKKYILPINQFSDYCAADDISDLQGNILFSLGDLFSSPEEDVKKIIEAGNKSIKIAAMRGNGISPHLRNTLFDHKITYEDAILDIYKVVRPGEIATFDVAKNLFESLFFDERRYDLLSVGRMRLNSRLKLKGDKDITVLTKNDVIHVLKELIRLQNVNGDADDIDHMGNRRIRSVGEFVDNQFRIGLLRMEKLIQEQIISVSDLDNVMPADLINSKVLVAVIKEFFVSSQLSQFMDQINPLSEITHKRRLSALGPGGLTRERAGFEVRDVHPSHYGRICPIETPEGQNIGLISSLATYARINSYGFIESPYRKVIDGVVTNEVVYLNAIDEENFNITQANIDLDEEGKIVSDFVYCRKKNEVELVSKEKVDYIDVSPKQIVSVAASLIPFLENDDANRALMGSNMQRQAVPLMRPDFPLVGTGMEKYVAKGSGTVLIAKRGGIIDYVDSANIVIRSADIDNFWIDSYSLIKFQKTNHNTCINQRSVVFVGQEVSEGQVIADGAATDGGELALGKNIIIAFMSWGGLNFEDSIVVSSKVIEQDKFTSVHIEEFECVVRDTRLGPEEITRDVPSIAEELLYHLDEFGIVHIGAEVEAGDVLVGKVTPKSESPMTPEEKLLKAIFGEKSIDVYDTSLCVPPGISGVVTDVCILSRRGIEPKGRSLLIKAQSKQEELTRKNYKIRILEGYVYQSLRGLLRDNTLSCDYLSYSESMVISEDMLDSINLSEWWDIPCVNDLQKIHNLRSQYDLRVSEIEKAYCDSLSKIDASDDLPQGALFVVKVFVAVNNRLQAGDKMSGRHGNKGVISKIVPEESMPYLKDGTSVEIILNPLGVPSRMNVGQVLETHLGWASMRLGMKIKNLLSLSDIVKLRELVFEIYKGSKIESTLLKMSDDEFIEFSKSLAFGVPVAAPVFESPSEAAIVRLLQLADCDSSGQEVLYDGRTGERFDRLVTVGSAYLLKLNHLVNTKIHARSVGSYSLITQQPLGGKSHFGGQRFGEMECWAYQAYGASFSLQEMLTVKSDDVVGRVKIYESIVRGENCFACGIPESFNVMVNELKALCLNVQLIKIDEKDSTF
ncbi:DNA-directed RNA polymerase subunit beta [Anaplasmataceae bacterium AB001_6]|nr:DNA-directed RNA polymerase subunit beta [Anaplasmataceae bacterium AB001_6]